MTTDERILRLERAFLSFAALSSGQAAESGTAEEIAAMEQQLTEDLHGIKDSVVAGS